MYILDLCTREIAEINEMPGGTWTSVTLDSKRLLSTSPHEIEWENFTTNGFLNCENSQLVVDNKDDAWDIEYYTREGTLLYR
jgi:hypothetical protein